MSNLNNNERMGLIVVVILAVSVVGKACQLSSNIMSSRNSPCQYESGLQWPYKWVKNGKTIGYACAKALYKGSSDVTVYYDGDYMFSGKFTGGVGNIVETFGGSIKTFGDVGICRGSNDGGKTRGVCYR